MPNGEKVVEGGRRGRGGAGNSAQWKVVEDFFDSLSPDFINNCVGNIRRRAELCIKSKGGHFEHLL